MIGVLVSGEGTNLQALIDAGLPIAAVASNRGDAGALARADEAAIPNRVFDLDAYPDRAARDRELADWLQLRGVELVVLAGYMHLLAPHTLYLDEVRSRCAHAEVRALAHVTGGGILGNLSRVVPEGLEARIDWDAWERPPVFEWLAEQGIEEDELRRVFNLGIGMCEVVPDAPEDATVIGELA